MDLKLKNKIVLVTASGQGIGAETAKQFLLEGARVLVNDINKERLRSFYKQLKGDFKTRVDYFVGDMCDENAMLELKKHLISKWRGLDILVTNLGTGKSLLADRLDIKEWHRFMEVNLFSAVKLLKVLLPIMKKRKGGSIVMISSIVGLQQSRGPLGYSAAKSSVLSLVKNLSYDLAPFGIRINAIAPG